MDNMTLLHEQFVRWLENWGKQEPMRNGSVCPNCSVGVLEEEYNPDLESLFFCRNCFYLWVLPKMPVDYVHIDFVIGGNKDA